jgi:tripartite-type tricarboxylate transporter receptor subunit TctC
MKCKYVSAILASIFFVAASAGAQAQTWPQKPIRLLVPFAVGGNTDGIARVTAERLSTLLGQQIIVENRPGANGMIAAQMVQRAPNDGYTLLMAAMPIMAILPRISTVPYDPIKDFAPISNLGSNPFVLGVNKNVEAKSVKELVDMAKAAPGKYNFASGGSGSVSHLSGALFLERAHVEMMHVNYKGDAPAIAALLGGEVTMYFGNFSALAPQAKSGNIRLIAVSSEKRVAQFPDLPTIAESYPGFRTATWNGLMAPAGTPRAVIDRIVAEVKKVAKDPVYQERMANLGVDIVADTPEQFAQTIKSDIDIWADAVKAANLKVE